MTKKKKKPTSLSHTIPCKLDYVGYKETNETFETTYHLQNVGTIVRINYGRQRERAATVELA